MGYEQKNKKIDSRLRLCAERLKRLSRRLSIGRTMLRRFDPATKKGVAHNSVFRKQLHGIFVDPLPKRVRGARCSARARQAVLPA
jgi:hypothetical protein